MKKARILPLLIGCNLALSGCVYWPPEGYGGMAEFDPGTLIPVEADQPLEPKHGMRFDLELLDQQLNLLVLDGAELCFPATVVQAEKRQHRILRELAGGLYYDAANDLLIQRQLLNRLERQLDYIKGNDLCVVPMNEGSDPPGALGRQITDLLNRDNQFASGSPALNPKYIAHLAEAAALLRENHGFRLRIIGHADSSETIEEESIALQRAEQVGRYLQVMGLSPKRIQIDTVDASDPLFHDHTAEGQLDNRRVTIELLEAPTPTLAEWRKLQ